MTRIVGIDLGTTNSLIAYMEGDTPRVIPGRHGRTLVPSVVAMTDNGLLVGDPAKEHLVRNPERTIYSVKRDALWPDHPRAGRCQSWRRRREIGRPHV